MIVCGLYIQDKNGLGLKLLVIKFICKLLLRKIFVLKCRNYSKLNDKHNHGLVCVIYHNTSTCTQTRTQRTSILDCTKVHLLPMLTTTVDLQSHCPNYPPPVTSSVLVSQCIVHIAIIIVGRLQRDTITMDLDCGRITLPNRNTVLQESNKRQHWTVCPVWVWLQKVLLHLKYHFNSL